MDELLISRKSVSDLSDKIDKSEETFCSGLFLSARWFVVSQVNRQGINFIVLPDRDSAEYCSSDLYNLIDGDRVFFLPDSGKKIEKSNYKSSLGVQRTSSIGKIMEYDGAEQLFFVTYPEALEEPVPEVVGDGASVFRIREGDSYDRDVLIDKLFSMGFTRVDFVSEPGQYAVRGALVDIFSYSWNNPYRISFFGDEVDGISVFDCNSQLSKEKLSEVEIFADLSADGDAEGKTVSVMELLPESTLVWLDSSDMYKEKEFYGGLKKFRRVFLEVPISASGVSPVKFNIAPQPVFNKNFELLTEDLRDKIGRGYRVCICGEKKSQLERLESILLQNEGYLPEFVPSRTVHSGFIDNEDKVCVYSDHEIFDRFHRVSLRRTVEKSEQLTINDLTSFAIGDYIVHIDYGVGIFGGLVRMKDDKGRMHEVVKLIYKDNDVVFVSVHAMHKISRYRSKDSEPPKIYKLGSKTWQTLKSNAKKKVKDIAKDLIKLYAKRRASKGFAFSPDTFLQTELESSFM